MHLYKISEINASMSLVCNMDVTPVPSNSKCNNSDFSIERILSDEKRREDSEVPRWLCCSRYQPPRIPRPVPSSGCRARRSGRHARVPFTAAQAAALEAAYARAPYLAPPALRALAAALQLRDDRIKIWFQNRRARERREKSSIIVPPLPSVPLPATNRGNRLYISDLARDSLHTSPQRNYENRLKAEIQETECDDASVSLRFRHSSNSENDEEITLDVESVDT